MRTGVLCALTKLSAGTNRSDSRDLSRKSNNEENRRGFDVEEHSVFIGTGYLGLRGRERINLDAFSQWAEWRFYTEEAGASACHRLSSPYAWQLWFAAP